jgi:hypothetical protein
MSKKMILNMEKRDVAEVTPAPTGLSRCWTIFIVQHSHIDIGYTEKQELTAAQHAQFIRQAIELALSPRQKTRDDDSRFKFTCEGFWQIEQFLARATAKERHDVDSALVKSDRMDVAGAPSLFNAGLIDPIAPSYGVFAVFNRWAGKDKTMVALDGLGHDWSAEFDRHAWKWLDGVLKTPTGNRISSRPPTGSSTACLPTSYKIMLDENQRMVNAIDRSAQ